MLRKRSLTVALTIHIFFFSMTEKTFPLILSVVAFDYGRWLIFCFYLMIFFLGLFTKRNKNLNSKNKKFSLFLLLLIWCATFVYLVTWQPYHWAGDEGHLINMNEYYVFSNLYYFYSNMSNLFLIFHWIDILNKHRGSNLTKNIDVTIFFWKKLFRNVWEVMLLWYDSEFLYCKLLIILSVEDCLAIIRTNFIGFSINFDFGVWLLF